MKRKPEIAYINLGYSLNKYFPKEKVMNQEIDALDDEDLDYCVDFFFDSRKNDIFRIDININEYLTILKAIQEDHLPLNNNISNIFHILINSGAVIKSAFLSEDIKVGSLIEDETEINMRLSIVFPNKGISILNFDVSDGIILSKLLGFPISITEKLFNKYATVSGFNDYDDDYEDFL